MAQKTTVSCGTDLNIQNAQGLKERLIKALSKAPTCTLNGSKVERVDSAGMQLLIAFFKEAEQSNVTIKWQAPSESLIKAGRLLGVIEPLKLETYSGELQ